MNSPTSLAAVLLNLCLLVVAPPHTRGEPVPPREHAATLAEWNGGTVFEDLFLDYLDEVPLTRRIPPPGMTYSQWKSILLRELVSNLLLADRATSEGLESDPKYDRLRAHFLHDHLLHLLHRREVEEPVEITSADVWSHYCAHPEEFIAPSQFRLRIISFSDRSKSQAFAKFLSDGWSFNRLENAFSEMSAVSRGKALGPYTLDQLRGMFGTPLVADTIARTPAGQTTPLIDTGADFYFIRVEEASEPNLRPPEEVFTEIHDRLAAEHYNRLYQDLNRKAFDAMTPRVHPTALDAATSPSAHSVVVLAIGERQWTAADFEAAYQDRNPLRDDDALPRDEFLDEFVRRNVQLAHARTLGIADLPEYRDRFSWFRANQLSNLWLERAIDAGYTPGPDDARHYFDTHPGEFVDGSDPNHGPPPFERVREVAATKALVAGREAFRRRLRQEELQRAQYREFPKRFFPAGTLTLKEAYAEFRDHFPDRRCTFLGASALQPQHALDRSGWGRRSSWRLYFLDEQEQHFAIDISPGKAIPGPRESSAPDGASASTSISDTPGSEGSAGIDPSRWLLDSPSVEHLALESWGREFLRRREAQCTVALTFGAAPESGEFGEHPEEYLFLLTAPTGETLAVAVHMETGQTRRCWGPEPR